MFCLKCGKQIPEDSFSCSNCGAKVVDTSTSSPQQNTDTSASTEKNKQKFNKNYNLALIKISIVIASVIAVVAIVYFCNNKAIKNNVSLTELNKESKRLKIIRMNSTAGKILSNNQYKLDAGHIVKLKNGKYEKKSDYDYMLVVFEDFSLGDINKDGVEDAVVILSYNRGGSGTYYRLFAVINTEGKFQQRGEPLQLGDRIILNSIIIKNGIITTDLITQSTKDAICCPTKREIEKYQLIGNNLTFLE